MWQRFYSGEVSLEEYKQEILANTVWRENAVGMWDDISILAETFYHFAWRLILVIKGEAGNRYKFPGGLGRVNVPAIKTVRNHLIQHPEGKDGQNFTLGLVVTSAGPVFRSLGATIGGEPGRVEPLSDSVEPGLFVSAERLRDELLRRLDDAISKTSNNSGREAG